MLATQTMTTAQAAVYLNVSPRTVQRLVADGELTALMKLPGRTGAYVFDAATVQAYKSAHRELQDVAGPGRKLPAAGQDPSHTGTYSN